MCNLQRRMANLAPASLRKLNWILQQFQNGANYRDVFGQKLHSYTKNIEWISIRLSQSDRAIVARNRDGDFQLLYAGPHADYNKIVGPKLKKRLVNPWKK